MTLMPAQDQCLDRKQQRLNTQQHRMHDSDSVDGVQPDALQQASLLCGDEVMVAGVGVCNTTATRRDALKTTFIDGLHQDKFRTRLQALLGFEELFAAPELASCDIILHASNDHWDNDPRF